ncbi:hypothetical protein [Burkholderia sp. PR2]|uniref:hypothetical protein n=1 Tax=Burkholderia sp. PR2 TaxID=3448078 RepID=UPI00402A795F
MFKKLFDRDAKSAAGALVVLLYGVFPMFLFGSLLAAIGSHPEVAAVLKNEPVYRYVTWWDGGTKWIPLWFGAVAVGSLFCGVERLVRAVTTGAEWKYMPHVRKGVKDYTLKPFLSALAFVDGLMVNDPRVCIAVFLMGAVLAFWSLHLLKVSES